MDIFESIAEVKENRGVFQWGRGGAGIALTWGKMGRKGFRKTSKMVMTKEKKVGCSS